MKKTRFTGVLWLIAAFLLASAIAYGFYPRAVQVDVVSVEKGIIEATVNDDGETRIREKYLVSAPVTGKLLRLRLHPGDRVVHGKTVLATIEPTDPSLLDARAKAESQARLKATEAAVQQADQAVARWREALELAEHDHKRAAELYERKAISRAEFDQADHHLRMTAADARAAEFAKQVSTYEYEQAQSALDFTMGKERQPEGTPYDIYSPIDGQVLRVFHEDSSVVAAGKNLLEIGDVRDLELVIDVLSTDAVRVTPGCKVYIEHWGGHQSLEGRVRLVEPAAFLKISALGVEEKRVNVIADFVTPEQATLGDGFRIEARIVVGSTSEDELHVPNGVLFRSGESWRSYRVERGRARLITVKAGISNGQRTQVLSGLDLGDRLILYPTDKVRDGVRVFGKVSAGGELE